MLRSEYSAEEYMRSERSETIALSSVSVLTLSPSSRPNLRQMYALSPGDTPAKSTAPRRTISGRKASTGRWMRLGA